MPVSDGLEAACNVDSYAEQKKPIALFSHKVSRKVTQHLPRAGDSLPNARVVSLLWELEVLERST